MPTYEYVCTKCGHAFEAGQSMHDKPLTVCPQCGQRVRRVISGGTGIIIKGGGSCSTGSCALRTRGTTCCGSDTPCGTPACGL